MTGLRPGWLYHCRGASQQLQPQSASLWKIAQNCRYAWVRFRFSQNRSPVNCRVALNFYGLSSFTPGDCTMGFILKRLYSRRCIHMPRNPLHPLFSQRPIHDLFKHGTKPVQCSVAWVHPWHFSYAFPLRGIMGSTDKAFKDWGPIECTVDSDGCSNTKPKAICSLSSLPSRSKSHELPNSKFQSHNFGGGARRSFIFLCQKGNLDIFLFCRTQKKTSLCPQRTHCTGITWRLRLQINKQKVKELWIIPFWVFKWQGWGFLGNCPTSFESWTHQTSSNLHYLLDIFLLQLMYWG